MSLESYLLRHATPDDLPALYRVCLKTGNSGRDATALQDDPDILGEVYVGPYVVLEPDLAFALDSPHGPIGYLLGALDTVRFNDRLEREWLPRLQKAHRDPGGDAKTWRGSDWVRHVLHHPFLEVPAVLAPYPSHAHIDLLIEARGHGIGRHLMQTMMERLTELGSSGLHLQVSPKNEGAREFYHALGFEVLSSPDLPGDTLFMARHLGELHGAN
ncbi:GNAT family N-acetyltransferase [Nordella sp. HKS 07]|uniref:GNAT family N-acetyltransferase n=1 Tax=Nordella sp. HKS 07 TaxID=2712222 RepID=UPI0013E179E0|nr:GNAT family N-acetyltransferase [Nordella sp. HKS 07]QIG46499.1 GNAT family N-acetyltransferase [Nordella sp. HKS 07]